jgi:hypothetical protein
MQRKINNYIKANRRMTPFGEIGPGEEELVQLLLFDDRGNQVAYVTGPALHNRMRLTTQVPAHIEVASVVKRNPVRIKTMKVSFVKSYANITNENVPLLEILDTLKGFKRIADLDEQMVIKRLTAIIDGLTVTETQQLIDYGLEYPPRTRALLGAILAMQKRLGLGIEELAKSLIQKLFII